MMQHKLRHHFNTISSCYLWSTDFQSLLKTNCNRNNEDPVEAAVEISLNNRTLKILSTAPIPLTRAACDSKSESEAYTTDENDI
ncbi:unnamed protein product [Rotaria sordida]|uniref:Uncharacterized protein n=1 Tax=Rotaria sordida TaxID=392033 RepID=A0A819H7R6_9BILA|nr:unnamed protein product [Rotaria sordida]CAF3899154.1 unnamed protein product [Rotaria sordida]